MDITIAHITVLLVTGFAAGIINTLAGGGSNLTLPALIIMGMPADIANATNRVGVVLQSLVASLGFKKHGKLPTHDLVPILLPTLIGSAIGAAFASVAPVALLKPMLLSSMIAMTLVMIIKPEIIVVPTGTVSLTMREKPSAWLWLTIAGFYGGFVQAGVGFILITALAGTLRYDLVRTNALKVVCAFFFTSIALAIFAWQGQVLWIPGLILACGTMAGAHCAVRFAISAKPSTLKWFLLVMTVCGSVTAMFF